MTMVCGIDLHRQQITFDSLVVESGEQWRGRLWQPDRLRFRRWLRQDVARRANGDSVSFAVEGGTGWRYVVEEITTAGVRGASGRAGRYPSSAWSETARQDRPFRFSVATRVAAGGQTPGVVDRARGGVGVAGAGAGLQVVGRSAHDLGSADPRRVVSARRSRSRECHPGREDPGHAAFSGARVEFGGSATHRLGYSMIDAIDVLAKPLKADLQRFGQRQAGCRAVVDAQYGIGGLLAVAIWSELGDCQRFARSDQVVRHSGLDVTVDSSDRRRASGFLSRQGPQTLRWALYEAAKNSSHHRSPDHDYYATVKDRHDGKLAAISMARKLARRSYHILRAVDPDVVYATP
jgi:transposase